jgi:hypothetical protein
LISSSDQGKVSRVPSRDLIQRNPKAVPAFMPTPLPAQDLAPLHRPSWENDVLTVP